MKPITLHLTNLQPGANFVRIGIPLPKGAVSDCAELTIVDLPGMTISSAFKTTATWADGSVKWCLAKIAVLDCQAQNINLKVQSELSLKNATEHSERLVNTTVTTDGALVQSGTAKIEFTKDHVFPTVKSNDSTIWDTGTTYPALTLTDGSVCAFEFDELHIEEQDHISCKIKVIGKYRVSAQQMLNAKFTFEALPEQQLTLVCELHNPHRAAHTNGIWDLGDSGSIRFKDFAVVMQHSNHTTKLKPDPGTDWITANTPTVLFQASSGGDNWDSETHQNASGKVCNKFCGYQITSNDKLQHTGRRSTPLLAINTDINNTYTVRCENFWQNFPKSMDLDEEEIGLRLYPHHHGDEHEIQGGERKTHDVTFRFFVSRDQLQPAHSAATARVAADAYKDAGIFSYFDDSRRSKSYDTLIEVSKDKDRGFYAKRETLDEYGWRNFGDVYADHETAYHDSDKAFVSHYNNQYDGIYGFAKQYALTGDEFWQPLFKDLARHVMDIDIYRTEEDRAEYNNGLFWHTDHYLEAYTSSHRTYSAKQADCNGNQTQGGGPGPEHCYTTGLVYYYYMTGDEEAKKTVLGLGEWITNYHEGTGTLLETAKRTVSEDSKSFIKTCKGAKIFKYHYPMDRGTGNYMRALMDCYELTADVTYLVQVENIIRNTAGPHDEIEARNLDDVEYNWWYVVYLQDLIRYLDLKRALDQHDSNFHYARSTLLYYSKWMISNDKPFLESADRLEYPNATWTAQESRKIHVFYAAYKYAVRDRAIYLERARFYRDYVTEELSRCDTLYFARIQTLLLQNHGPAAFLDTDSLPYPGVRDVEISAKDRCFHTPASHLKHIGKRWMSSLSNFKISNELRWLKARAS